MNKIKITLGHWLACALLTFALFGAACTDQTREEVIARFPGGEKKVVAVYKGSGADEILLERRTFVVSGELALLEDLVEGTTVRWTDMNIADTKCVAIGSLSLKQATELQSNFEHMGSLTHIQEGIGDVFVGHWVKIPNVTDDQSASDMLDKLSTGGLGDAYLVRNDEEGIYISLGLFEDIKRAERIQSQARSLGVPAEIVPRSREGSVYFLNVGFLPGDDASELIEQFVAKMVTEGESGKCP